MERPSLVPWGLSPSELGGAMFTAHSSRRSTRKQRNGTIDVQVAGAFFVSQSQSQRVQREACAEVIDPILIAVEDRRRSFDGVAKRCPTGKVRT